MNQKYGEFVGVDNLHAAIIIKDNENEYLTEIPEYFAPTAEITGEPKTENASTYYDNVASNNYVTEGETPLSITVSGIPADKAAKYLGKHYNAETGRVYDTGKPNPPYVALSFRFDKGVDGYRYYQYLKGTFSGGAEEAVSKSDKTDIKTYKMTFTAITTTFKWLIDGAVKPLKRIFADTADLAFNSAGWFNQVQTPDTDVQPTAFSLVSSVPADDSTGVAISSEITLSFNNKVLSDVMTLYTNTFVPVPVVITKDVSGKILTIKPVNALTAAMSYVLIITNVTDVYGQKLENEVIAFTTA